MTNGKVRPAWSNQFEAEAIKELSLPGSLGAVTREWAWGGSTGRGVRVAVIDSGIEHDHPALEGSVVSGVVVQIDESLEDPIVYVPEENPIDVAGHGTACAGIIHSIAPEAEIYSVRVLGRGATGRALQFAGGLEWTVDNEMHVCNLSLSTSREEFYGLFHKLTDAAYFKNTLLVSAVNNVPAPSYPSLYSSVISVAAHESHDPLTYYYNPSPPVEFGAPGIDVKVPWRGKGYMMSTGNSFAAPHIAGIVALIRAKHPNLTPFQIKTVLYACANNIHLSPTE